MIGLLFWTLAAVQLMGIAESAVLNSELPIRLKDALKEADIPLGKDWQLIQHYQVGATNAFKTKTWEDYTKIGFGSSNLKDTHFWYGLDRLHETTSAGRWQLLIGMLSDKHPSYRLIIYNDFKIGSASKGYRLHIGARDYSYPDAEQAGLGLEYHNGYPFSTPDNDLDVYDGSCAKEYKAGWWFANCVHTCLNCDDLGSGVPASERYMAIRKMADGGSQE